MQTAMHSWVYIASKTCQLDSALSSKWDVSTAYYGALIATAASKYQSQKRIRMHMPTFHTIVKGGFPSLNRS